MSIFDPSLNTEGIKGIKSLKKKFPGDTPIFVVFNLVRPLLHSKDYTPRIIPVPHAIAKLEERSILLITKDPSTPYAHLNDRGQPTEDVFNAIYSFKRLRSEAKRHSNLVKLFKEYDIVVADFRIHKFLPLVLGEVFYVKNKKIPFKIQMARPLPTAKLEKDKTNKFKDLRCEPKYVRHQIKLIAENTYFIPPAQGNCMVVKAGHSNMPAEHIVANIRVIIDYLTNPKFRPVGGLADAGCIESIFVKTSDSVSIPVFIKEKPGDDDEHDDSDFDF